jgi:D-lactate dehydrogenase
VFRAGGTSLTGQAQSGDLLVDVRRHWVGLEVLDDGRRVRVRPGTTIGQVNLALRRFGRVLGPDPASSAVACVGGVVANNSSGMAAGVAHNAYRTVRSYSIKNTHGYRLDAFLDGDTPVEIFRRLIVGSQGTLAFVAEVVFDTIPLGRLHSTALLIFPTLEDGAAAVPGFVAAGARAVELMDANTLRLSGHRPEAPASWSVLPDDCCGLLVELRAPDEASLDALSERANRVVDSDPLGSPQSSPATTARPGSSGTCERA